MTRKIKLFVLLITLGVVFAAFPRKSAAQFNQPGQRKTLLLPGAEVSRAALRRRARRAGILCSADPKRSHRSANGS